MRQKLPGMDDTPRAERETEEQQAAHHSYPPSSTGSSPDSTIMQAPPPPQQQYHSYNGVLPTTSPPQPTSATLPPLHQPFEAPPPMQSHPPPYATMSMNGAIPQHPQPPPYNPNQFAYQNGAAMPPTAPMAPAAGQNGMMRFPIPPQPVNPAQMAGGRHKKDIKRRTKTGCLTCRKRRIKCDEGHPTCRNCQKSKRECLGYDPIFKTASGPAPIQPAPPSVGTPKSNSTPTSAIPPNAYQTPHVYPGTGGTFVPASNPAQGVEGGFEYGASLDPALAGGVSSIPMTTNSYSTALQPARKPKPLTMDQLFSLNGIAPPYQAREAPPPGSSLPQIEVDDFYRFHYGPGLDRLFETTWYTTRGLQHLRQDPTLVDFVSQCAQQMKTPDGSSAAPTQSLEARLIWQLAIMPRSAPIDSNTNGASNDQLTLDLLPRIDTLEHLLTGQFLPTPKIPPPPTPAQQSNQNMHAEMTFWHQLGVFTSNHDDDPNSSTNDLRAINDALATMRGILNNTESRDVLYSFAVARHIGGRLSEYHPRHPLPAAISAVATNDPNDPGVKLRIAHQFVESEGAKGTTQVIQRLCQMAMRSWALEKE